MGSTETVLPTDASRRADFLLFSRGSYLAQFTLPTELKSTGGGSVPLSFGPGDGITQRRSTRTLFDPTQPFPFSSSRFFPARRFFLGGTAGPVVGAPAGSYTAVITLLIIQAGA